MTFYFFLDFLFLLQTLQYILTYLDSTENTLIWFCYSFYIHYEKINLYTLIPIPLNMKSINPRQTYPQIIESNACIL